jgi:hypothetical protein
MADLEIIKHAKAAIAASRDRTKKWPHKLQEILLEVAIIVFAVSLSIWLHNWSERRKDRLEEREFLAGLKKDLLADIAEMKGDRDSYQSGLKAIKYFERVGGGERLNNDSLNAYQWIFVAVAQINPRVSRFEALKGSGRMSIVENKELLLNITDLYAKDFPRIVRRNDFVNSLIQNTLMPVIASRLELDANGQGTNWQEVLRLSQVRLMVFQTETVGNNINAYSTGIDKCLLIIKQIDGELG